jgi:hypothetical protein
MQLHCWLCVDIADVKCVQLNCGELCGVPNWECVRRRTSATGSMRVRCWILFACWSYYSLRWSGWVMHKLHRRTLLCGSLRGTSAMFLLGGVFFSHGDSHSVQRYDRVVHTMRHWAFMCRQRCDAERVYVHTWLRIYVKHVHRLRHNDRVLFSVHCRSRVCGWVRAANRV